MADTDTQTDTQTKIIELLKKPSVINTYVSFLQNCIKNRKITTRAIGRLATTGCWKWQLQYCILTLIYGKGKNHVLHENPDFLNILCNPYHYIFSLPSQSPVLYDFITRNNLPTKPPEPPEPPLKYLRYATQKEEFESHIKDSRNKNIYLCMYGIHKDGSIYQNEVAHYFTIIKNNEKFYLTSSYGSSWIKVPYGIVEITTEKLYEFCENLKNRALPAKGTEPDKKKDEGIATFMKTYFLSNGIEQRYSEDDIDNSSGLFSLWIPVNYGVQKEIDYILTNSEMKFDIAIITNYEELVLTELVKCQYNYKDYEYVRDALNKFHLCAPPPPQSFNPDVFRDVRLSLGTSDSTVPFGLPRRKGTDKFANARRRVLPELAQLPEPAQLPKPLKFTPDSAASNSPSNSPFNFGAPAAPVNFGAPFNFGAPAAPVNFGAASNSADSADTVEKMKQDGGSIKNGNYKKWKSQKNNVRFSSYFKKSKKHKLKK